jgi:hypothetical protein
LHQRPVGHNQEFIGSIWIDGELWRCMVHEYHIMIGNMLQVIVDHLRSLQINCTHYGPRMAWFKTDKSPHCQIWIDSGVLHIRKGYLEDDRLMAEVNLADHDALDVIAKIIQHGGCTGNEADRTGVGSL